MTKRSRIKQIPEYKSEADEREFWQTVDSVDYVDWTQARIGIFPDLKPSTETISLRLPAGLLAELKALANQRDVPYQSLLKIFLAERIAAERSRLGVRSSQRIARMTGVAERPVGRSSRPTETAGRPRRPSPHGKK